MAKEIPIEKRFWQRVELIPFHECWEWTGYKDKDGYGTIWKKGTNKKAHRVSIELHNGIIPENKLVCHKCDNPGCVRPDHLFVGTFIDNNRDTVNKKRHVNNKKTHCKHGHEFSIKNTRILKNKKRLCKTCSKKNSLAAYHKRKLFP